jgi:cytochrome c-type biogenesis protein CcmE
MMKAKRKRLLFALGGIGLLSLAVALVLSAFEENLVFFFSPSEIAAKAPPASQRIRLGGFVEEGSVQPTGEGLSVQFRVTDGASSLAVRFAGALPDLFREGQGVVAEGRVENGVFIASEVLAKHDENYMPAEVAEALKRSGNWQGGQGAEK